jgi:hypothetical protein
VLPVFSLYLAVLGGVTAGTQVARGAVRGVGRLAQGDPRGAAAEVIGGLAAPVVSAVRQLEQLGVDVCVAVAVLAATSPKEDRGSAAASTSVREGAQRATAVMVNGTV